MTNAEKYWTAKERAKAFNVWCNGNECNRCVLCNIGVELESSVCALYWLDLEAKEEKIENCPYCGNECRAEDDDGEHRVFCCADLSCRYSSGTYTTEHEAISAHNRFVRAAMETGKK